MLTENVAGVHILDVPYAADREYSYFIPEELRRENRLCVGCFVLVPFGRGNRESIAVVTSLVRRDTAEGLKPIADLRAEVLTNLTEAQLSLCAYLKEQTFCSFGEAVRCILPAGAVTSVEAVYSLALPVEEAAALKLKKKESAVLSAFEKRSSRSGNSLEEQFGREIRLTLRKMTERGILSAQYRLKDRAKVQTRYVYLRDPEEAEILRRDGRSEGKILRGEKQQAVLAYLLEHGITEWDTLRRETGATADTLRTLENKGVLTWETEEDDRDFGKTSSAESSGEGETIVLNAEQKAAAETILRLCQSQAPKAALLYGVTGSGKTRVMKEVIDGVLQSGKQVIVLVPEISLTPQTVGIFSSYYGDDVAVLHSSLSDGERFDAWRRMKSGRARICIGTRSAVFAPFEALGLIVIDEEQEHTYKSENSPRYHARDVARFRCAQSNAVMLLASATPSVESFYKAKNGIYTLVTLKQRYGEKQLPEAILCDMRGGDGSAIGDLLTRELEENFSKGEQSILFVNRRGYHPFLRCGLCGNVINCPHCSVSLTYHTKGRLKKEEDTPDGRSRSGYLSCHYCGYRQPLPRSCPECGSEQLTFLGYGTQMVESALSQRYPGRKILRMDADTTASKFAYDRMLKGFRRGEQDLLLGTQMVAKGHDFPGVTLVGIVMADSGLYLDDYRAGERTFSLVTQVIGRAGRGKRPGRAVIQTCSPDHPTLRLAAAQDYDGFYENEIALRKALCFPPFCDLALVTLSCSDENFLQNAVLRLNERFRALLCEEFRDVKLLLFGPFEAPVYRVNGKYRMRFVMKCRANRRTRDFLRQAVLDFSERSGSKITVSVDLNPASL